MLSVQQNLSGLSYIAATKNNYFSIGKLSGRELILVPQSSNNYSSSLFIPIIREQWIFISKGRESQGFIPQQRENAGFNFQEGVAISFHKHRISLIQLKL
jgi:hypothetical protein